MIKMMNPKLYTIKDFAASNNCDIFTRSHEFRKFVSQVNSLGHKGYWNVASSGLGASVVLEDNDTPVSAFVSNDYLGMSQMNETKRAGIEAVIKYGTGACAAQPIGGYLDIHKKLEKSIAQFTGQEDSLVFSSGFGANAGLLRAVLGKNDIAYIDSYIHTSSLCGLRDLNVKHIGHNNVPYLEMVLKADKGKYGTSVVLIDGVYSQDGDLSVLPEIVDVCHRYGCLLIMDDAHGVGVMGKNGRGTAEHFGCLGKVDVVTGTCSKSFGCVGGFVASSFEIIQYLRYYADSNVFSAAMTPQVAGSVLKAIELIREKPQIREKLWDNVLYLRKRLEMEGFDVGKSQSPIFPIMIRDNRKVYEVSEELRKRGIYASGIVYPAVRTKEARIRVSVLATHEKWQLDYLVDSLVEIRKNILFKILIWRKKVQNKRNCRRTMKINVGKGEARRI